MGIVVGVGRVGTVICIELIGWVLATSEEVDDEEVAQAVSRKARQQQSRMG
jgi:hypothetical protein